MWLTYFGLWVLVAATLPAVVRGMLPPLPRCERNEPQAVVVLGAGRRQSNGKWVLTTRSLRRLQVAAEAAQAQRLPLVLSGGRNPLADDGPTEAALMADIAAIRWPAITVLQETESKNTWENAEHSAALLMPRGWDEVLLVSDRAHLPRAILCFRFHGIQVSPLWRRRLPASPWVPSAGALSMVPEIWYEWFALCWYAVRYFAR